MEEINNRLRGFEIVSGMENMGINLPRRKTKFSAGYDFEALEDITIEPGLDKPTLIKTGIKAFMQDDEALFLYNRSSNPKKKHLVLANSVGVIDADYYGSEGTDGHIMFAFFNVSEEPVQIKKGDSIGQGVFSKYLLADNESLDFMERTGGFGSTDKD